MTHIAACLDAVSKQTYAPMTVMVVDNASLDGTVNWIQEHFPSIHLLRNTRNVGFSRGHNQAIRLSDAPYVLVLNPDVILDPEWVGRAVAFMEDHPDYGAFGGKTRRYSYSHDELKETRFSDIIDSTGLHVSRSRHIIDIGSGMVDGEGFDHAHDVFGLSGSCVFFRRQALESARFRDEFFDEDFFAYKEDADLAWRLQRLGWKSRYEPGALAYHHRHIKGIAATSDLLIAKNHRSRQRQIGFFSYRNHWLMLMKNETWSSRWRDLPWIAWYEIRKFGFLLFFSPTTLRGLTGAIRLWPAMRRKAALLQKQQQQSGLTVRAWFT